MGPLCEGDRRIDSAVSTAEGQKERVCVGSHINDFFSLDLRGLAVNFERDDFLLVAEREGASNAAPLSPLLLEVESGLVEEDEDAEVLAASGEVPFLDFLLLEDRFPILSITQTSEFGGGEEDEGKRVFERERLC